MGGLAAGTLAVCGSARTAGYDYLHRTCLEHTTRWIVQDILHSTTSPYSSGSFGRDDPLTLAWLVALFTASTHLPALADSRGKQAWAHLKQAADQRVSRALAPANLDQPVFDFSDLHADARSRPSAVLHPLPVLRILQLAKLLSFDIDSRRTDLFEWFLNRLHRQLSLRGIEYSDFDIADVVFSLEGLLATDQPKVAAPIVEGVCQTIEEVRRLNPTLRPVTPFKTFPQGAVHLFSSVEVFGSLLRSSELLGGNEGIAFFTRIKPLLRDYLAWLQGTAISGQVGRPTDSSPPESGADRYPDEVPRRYFGWQSEHAHTEHRVVHVWLTSQVLLYLHGYQLLLARDVAHQALKSVDLRTEPPGQTSLGDDPVQLPDYRVIGRLRHDFIAPRQNGDRSTYLYSCLLYGPPGTGKTTLARWVADQLGWPLLTITTSDFIIDGEAQVEARAKRLFEALAWQRETVIFFDEIDRLVLDRDATAYHRQGDMLQFMTPSMLTKINNLRAAEQTVFIVGTNYAERIDAAIKRSGRIDRRLLVLPPDLAGRREVLRRALTRWHHDHGVDEDEIGAAAAAGALCTVPELHTAVRRYSDLGGPLRARVEEIEPAVSLTSCQRRIVEYQRRTADSRPDTPTDDLGSYPRELLEEAFLLAYLELEGVDGTPPRGQDWLRELWTARGREVVQDPTVRKRLDRAWPA
jgi:hypothetical protein